MQTVDSMNENLFLKHPITKGDFLVRISDCHNLKIEKLGYNKCFGEYCVEWFINEKIEIDLFSLISWEFMRDYPQNCCFHS